MKYLGFKKMIPNNSGRNGIASLANNSKVFAGSWLRWGFKIKSKNWIRKLDQLTLKIENANLTGSHVSCTLRFSKFRNGLWKCKRGVPGPMLWQRLLEGQTSTYFFKSSWNMRWHCWRVLDAWIAPVFCSCPCAVHMQYQFTLFENWPNVRQA